MSVSLRPARPKDVDGAVPLIYSSGPAVFDDAQSFLRGAFLDGDGVVGIGASYSGDSALQFTLTAARHVLSHYGGRGVGVMARGLRIERLIPPPTKSMQYIAQLGVHRA